MSEVKLGQLAPPDASRDAIHVAVVPCVAGQNLGRGWTVSIDKEGKAWAASVDDYVGVVDPFKACDNDTGYPVRAGERFWLLLKPGTVSNLRHSWAHPLFHDNDASATSAFSEREASKIWLIGWVQAFWPNDEPDQILAYLQAAIEKGEVCFGITSYHNALTGCEEEGTATFTQAFWLHYERYTGKTRPAGAIRFRCAC